MSEGGADGSDWKAGLSADAALDTVTERAKNSILKSNPDKIKAATVGVEKQLVAVALKAMRAKYRLGPVVTTDIDAIVKKAS